MATWKYRLERTAADQWQVGPDGEINIGGDISDDLAQKMVQTLNSQGVDSAFDPGTKKIRRIDGKNFKLKDTHTTRALSQLKSFLDNVLRAVDYSPPVVQ